VRAQTRGSGKRPAANDFYLKKSLPWFAISGIPRARAGTTNLLSTNNCIRFGNFQFRRAGAGAGAIHVGRRQSQRRGHKRRGPGDHGKDSARDF
jgi:hypothetical protein